jgi:hypothetical protein
MGGRIDGFAGGNRVVPGLLNGELIRQKGDKGDGCDLLKTIVFGIHQ